MEWWTGRRWLLPGWFGFLVPAGVFGSQTALDKGAGANGVAGTQITYAHELRSLVRNHHLYTWNAITCAHGWLLGWTGDTFRVDGETWGHLHIWWGGDMGTALGLMGGHGVDGGNIGDTFRVDAGAGGSGVVLMLAPVPVPVLVSIAVVVVVVVVVVDDDDVVVVVTWTCPMESQAMARH